MTTYNYEQLYKIMKEAFIANQDKVTDFNEGSVISSIFEAVARVVERIYVETRVGYNNNLKSIPYSVFDFTQKTGVKATSKGIFKSSKPIEIDTIINSGVRVTSGDLIYETTENAVIKAGETISNEVGLQATEIGSKYNGNVGSITGIQSLVPSYVVEFTNTEKISNGANTETSSEMLSRFKDYINGLQGTSYYGMKSNVLAINGVRSVSVVEHFPPENTYNFTIYVDDGTGGLSDELRNEVDKVVNGDGTPQYPGCRAAGVNVRFNAAQPIDIEIKVKCKIYRTEHEVAMYDIENAIKEIINNLTIGEDLLVTSLILVLRKIPYVRDVSSITINDQTGNIQIGESQICRFKSVNIELEDVR